MDRRRTAFSTLVATAVLCSAPLAQDPCFEWSSTFGAPGTSGAVNASAVYDDGSGTGPELYVVGQFQTAGSSIVSHIARWNGSYWRGVAGGLGHVANAAIVGDDGSGPALFVGGNFPTAGGTSAPSVAKWDGSTWSAFPPGFNGPVNALAFFDDGSGRALYAGGGFTHVAGTSTFVGGLARWRAGAWEPVPSAPSSLPFALAVHDDGSGAALYVGGTGLWHWNGSTWSSATAGFDSSPTLRIQALAVVDAPGGRELWAGGHFGIGGAAANVARLVGGVWQRVGGGTNGLVRTLHPRIEGSTGVVYVGGDFTTAGGTICPHVARFDGASFGPLGSGTTDNVHTLASFDQGGTSLVVAGGWFIGAGAFDAYRVAAWNGSAWAALGDGQGLARDVGGDVPPVRVFAFETFDDGHGPALFAGGQFQRAGGVVVANVARWDGTRWSSLAGGIAGGAGALPRVTALHVHDDGTGPALFATGTFAYAGSATTASIARWDGSRWTPLSTGIDPRPSGSPGGGLDLVSFDDGSGNALYVGGAFSGAGGIASPNLARWDGATWSAVGAPSGADYVSALAVFDDGAGARLYAGGMRAGGAEMYIARRDGGTWTLLPPLGGYYLSALHAHDDGSGPALYASGTSLTAFPLRDIVRWNGSAWSPVGSGLTTRADRMISFDDGSGGGAKLIAIGPPTAGGASVNGIAVWNGSTWSALDGGLGVGPKTALGVFDDGSGEGPSLFAGGEFITAGTNASWHVARWSRTGASGCASSTGVPYCFGDGTGAPCPCGNAGGPGRGCASSAQSIGARLEARGQAHVRDGTVTLVASGMGATTSTLFFQGTAVVSGGTGVWFGDGLRCTGGFVVRLAIRSASGGIASFGHDVAGDPSVAIAGGVPAVGAVRHYQSWYRDAQTFCTPSTFNLTNGVRIAWSP